jgi:hypothetical protein
MIHREQVELTDGHCCDCGGNLFHPGPRGGCAHNVMCASCGAKFWISPPLTPERIHNDDAAYHLGTMRTLDDITMSVLD